MKKTNYLYELLGALYPEELKVLTTLELTGRENALFNYYIDNISTAPPSKEAIAQTLEMSSAHIDKLGSILLKKIYLAIVGTDSRELWLFLRQRRLTRHLYHQLNLEEREIKKKSNSQLLASFYLDAFEAIHTMSFQDYNPREATRLMNAYFSLIPNASAAERLMIEGRHIRQQITNAQALGKITEVLRTINLDLERLELLVDESIPPLSLCQFYLAYAHYYKVVTPDTGMQRVYLGKALDIMLSYEEFTLEDTLLMRCKIADTYYQDSEFVVAYDQYKQIIPEHPEIFTAQFFFTSTFAQLSILCGDFEKTDAIIQEYYGGYLQQGGDGGQPAATASITLAKRFLLDHKPKEAYRYILIGFAANNKNILTAFEIELRKLETLYFIAIGDLFFAEELIDKHIKYLQSKGLSLKVSLHGIFFRLLRALLAERSTGKKLSVEFERLLKSQNESFVALYGRLLELVRAQNVSVRKPEENNL